MKVFLALACLSCVAVQMVAGIPDSFFVTRPEKCLASTQNPKKPLPLEFCHFHNDNSCCTPGNDAIAKDAFYGLLAVGYGCSASDHNVRATYSEVRHFMCMGCHPEEPTYRFRLTDGDGGNIAADPAAAPDSFAWRVCESFLQGRDLTSGLWGADATKYDRCGVNMPSTCQGVPFAGYDTSTSSFVYSTDTYVPPGANCGSEMIYPKAEYGADAESQRQAAQQFLAALPQWLPNFKFVIVNDTQPGFNYTATPCFRGGSSAMGRFIGVAVALAAFVTYLAAM
jgi:hypothetical protein